MQRSIGEMRPDSRWRHRQRAQGGVEEEGKMLARYADDAKGRRIAKTLFRNGTARTHRFIYNGSQLIGETDSQGRLTRRYVYLG
jgi:YD repeat-containing protein